MVAYGVAVQVGGGQRLADAVVVGGVRSVTENIFGAYRICVYDIVVFVKIAHPLAPVVAGHTQRVHTSVNVVVEIVAGYGIAPELFNGSEIAKRIIMGNALLQQPVLLVLHHDGVGQGDEIVSETVTVRNVGGEVFVRTGGIALVLIMDDVMVGVIFAHNLGDNLRGALLLIVAGDFRFV